MRFVKKALVDVCLADRGHVHHAALGPQVVETAGQVQFGARTEIGRPAFAVVADLLNDATSPTILPTPKSAV